MTKSNGKKLNEKQLAEFRTVCDAEVEAKMKLQEMHAAAVAAEAKRIRVVRNLLRAHGAPSNWGIDEDTGLIHAVEAPKR